MKKWLPYVIVCLLGVALICAVHVGCSGTRMSRLQVSPSEEEQLKLAVAEARQIIESGDGKAAEYYSVIEGREKLVWDINVSGGDYRARLWSNPNYSLQGSSYGYINNGNAQTIMILPTTTAAFDIRSDSPLMPLSDTAADELWVIIPAEGPAQPQEDDLGTGALLAKLPDQDQEVPVPLKHTSVKAEIMGYMGTVDVEQQFQNPHSVKIEAKYVFPLPSNAAVSEFIMVVGDRKIRGIIREREEAEKIYTEARAQGHVASLLTQERPNVFTQSVANIEPGKEIDIRIRYFHTLAYMDGAYEFVFPMVVGPRYNPPGFTGGIGAVPAGKPGTSGQPAEVQYLKPGQRSGHDISVAVNLDAGVKIENISCPSHAVSVSKTTSSRARIELGNLDSIPNKDFVLRFKVAGRELKSNLITHRDDRGGFFTMMLYPPDDLKSLERNPVEMVFVLDCSGSMSGVPISICKTGVRRALARLGPDDTFQIIRFSNDASALGPAPIPATPENVQKGLAYLDSLQGSGGTQVIEGVKAALDFPHDERRLRLVTFMTDGYIGNEQQILTEIHNRLGSSRIFSFGAGSSVNRYFLEQMARVGSGAVAWIGLNESAADIVDQFYDRIAHPALCDIEIDWGGLDVSDVYPHKVPDLFVGRPVILTGRFADSGGSATVRVSGTAGGEKKTISIPVDLDTPETHNGIPVVWARSKIAELMYQSVYGNADAPGQIKQVALEFGIMSNYTAFVAVDSLTVTEGGEGISVAVPVPMPEGVKYETTVAE